MMRSAIRFDGPPFTAEKVYLAMLDAGIVKGWDMTVKTLIKPSEYHDSVSLMLVARELSNLEGAGCRRGDGDRSEQIHPGRSRAADR